MKIGIFAIGIGNLARPDLITAAAIHSERLNFSTMWAPEHVVFLERYASQYPYSRGHNLPIPTEIPLLNPFVALTYAAARTSRIRLATGVCLVPEYNPLLLAKICATLDYLSGGRLALGIGIGWLREEFDAMGIPWERRARRTREYIEAMRCLWGEGRSYSAEFVNFDGALSFPKPIKGRDLPILVGGQSEAALKRAAAYGNGWCGFNLTPAETAQAIKRLRELLKDSGRDAAGFEFLVSPTTDEKPDDLKRYRDAGVDEVYLTPVFQHPINNEGELVKLVEDTARAWVEPGLKL
ncbi:MAG TPA: LLM class F420-dependent oxidoreductase [Candidatus Binataceae bacterium]|nr:LLM class F420-dependent oxidoreductase [Candidatus Binataceae bacterium]